MQSHVRRRLQNGTSCYMTEDEQFYKWGHDEENHLRKIQVYVLLSTALLAVLCLLSVLKKRFCKVWLNIMSSACYLMVPILLSYTLALMGEPGNTFGEGGLFTVLYSLWGVLLLLGYASFDNLSVFSPEERNGRSKLVFQFLIQFILILLFAYILPWKNQLVPILLAFLIVCFKVVERIVALAYAAGVTPGIKDSLRQMINYMNKEEEGVVDPAGMKGFKYLVGPRYSDTKDGVIVEGISVENIWECKGSLLSSESGGGDRDGKLKDICLSFALFWLLLGKFWGYPLYKGDYSREKAWKLVHDGLLVGKLGGSERVFRVIEVELNFLRDYFYSKYTFFYFNGFYWKLYVLTFPVMFWWFTQNAFTFMENTPLLVKTHGVDKFFRTKTTTMMISVILFLEVFQLFMLITSGWFRVALVSYYAKRKMSRNKSRLLDCCFEKVVKVICRISQCPSITLSRPWKQELDQYSLLESCTSFGVNNVLQVITSVFGIPGLPKAGRKQATSVVLSENVKTAVVLALQKNGPKLSNGVASLRRNEVEEDLSWACKLECDAEVILVWHIATSFCEMSRKSQQNSLQPPRDFNVATSLSKYCAYLLVFSPSLLHVPLLEAEGICDNAINEARNLFKKQGSPRGYIGEVSKYEKLLESLSDKEVGARRTTTIQRGSQLGHDLLFKVKDEGRRWKILAELWAEMILFLAPSNNNEMAHVEKLVVGGEFITHLWALLTHVGIVDRNN